MIYSSGRGISTAGSAPHWQCGGHGFESRMLHFLLYRKFLLNHELCKQIALQKQGTENRRLRLEDIKTFFSKIVIVDIIKFM